MNNTITLSQLITRLAAVSGVDNNTARKFLRARFATVEDNVAAGHTITIKGIGTFRPVANDLDSGNTTVAFTPDKDLAAELNRPFEVFSAVELADGVTFDEPQQETPVEETHDEDETPVFLAEPEEEPEPQQEIEHRQEPEPQTLRWPEEEEEEPAVTAEVITPEEPEEEPERVITAHEPEKPRRNLLWLWIGLIFLAVIAGAYLAAVYTTPVTPRPQIEEESPEPADLQIEEVSVEDIAPMQQENSTPDVAATTPAAPAEVTPAPAQEEKKPVYDTVDVSLIRLAKKHYGESSYWVFIYEANSDKIPNPNRIRPGQKVLIPDQSTFPGSTKAETVKIAKTKQTELLQRFK